MANTSDLSAARIGGIKDVELPSDPRRLPSPCVWRRLVPAMAALTCPSPSPVPALTRDPRAPAEDEVPDENCVPPGPYLRRQRGMLTLCLRTVAPNTSSCSAAIARIASSSLTVCFNDSKHFMLLPSSEIQGAQCYCTLLCN